VAVPLGPPPEISLYHYPVYGAEMLVRDAIIEVAVGAVKLSLEALDARLIRTRHILESMYEKISDRAMTQCLDVLAWMLSLLRALSSILPGIVGLPQY